MRENVSFTIDCLAVVLIALALWLVGYRRRSFGLALGVVGIATISAATAMRAYPEPTRAALRENVERLGNELTKFTELLRISGVQTADLRLKLERANEQLKEREDSQRTSEAARLEAENKFSRMASRFTSVLSNGFRTVHWDLDRLSSPELVLGKRGTYFVVRLKDTTGSQFIFPLGDYKISALAVREAADRFVTEFIDGIRDMGATFEVFIRGGATAEKWIGPEGAGAEFGAIIFRKLDHNGRYGELSESTPFPVRPSNDDLPLLRAAFFLNAIGPSFPNAELLHKQPTESDDERERTVELVLYLRGAD